MAIILYDIPSAVPTNAWSPNTFKARAALLFKGIPFTTEWVEYPDIEEKMKSIGAAPTGTWKDDGRPQYTLPVINDTSTGRVVSDSLAIAQYLETTYPAPQHPALFPLGATAPADVYEDFFSAAAFAPVLLLLLAASHDVLNPPSAAYFRRTRERAFGLAIEEFAPAGSEKRAAAWAACQAGMSKVSAKLGEKPYYFGDVLSYADLLLVSHLLWMKIVVGPESAEWKAVEQWDGGRWAKLLASTEKFQIVA